MITVGKKYEYDKKILGIYIDSAVYNDLDLLTKGEYKMLIKDIKDMITDRIKEKKK